MIVSVGVPGSRLGSVTRSAAIRRDPLVEAQPGAAQPPPDPAQLGPPYVEAVIANSSTSHGYLSDYRLRISQFDPSGRRIYQAVMSQDEVRQQIGVGLVAGGQARRFRIPACTARARWNGYGGMLGNAPRR